MPTTVTIHRGELLQIKRIITNIKEKKKKKLHGSLHGLYTESDQPVIQIVCGGNKKQIESYLEKNHGLVTLGEWVVSDSVDKAPKTSKKNIALLFDYNGEIVSAYDGNGTAVMDILEGQSAFRIYQDLEKDLKDKTGFDSSPVQTVLEDKRKDLIQPQHQPRSSQLRNIKDHKNDVACHNDDVARHTHTTQWYNTDRDNLNNTIEFVRCSFTDNGDVMISRNTSTENMTFKFNHDQCVWDIEFPSDFPSGTVKLRKINEGGNSTEGSVTTNSADLESMKNNLKERFAKMCNCQRCTLHCQKSTHQGAVSWV